MTCSSCNGKCRTPEACHQPEAGPPRWSFPAIPGRAKTFRPTYEIEAPPRRRRRERSPWPWLILAILSMVLMLAGLVFPIIHRFPH